MVHVTILVRVLWPGGPQRIAIKEAKLLRESGFDVELVFIRDTKRKVEGLTETPYKVVFDSASSNRLFQKLFYMITKHYNPGRGADATVDLDLIARYDFSGNYSDVVIYFDQFASLFSIFRKMRKPFKKIIVIHETAFREKSLLKKIIERIALVNSQYIVTNSDFNKKILLKNGYLNVETVYPGVDMRSDILSFDERSNTCIVVTVFEPWRKPELLIDIALYLRNTKIIMAGQWTDENYRRKIDEEIVRKNLADRITITGLIDQSTLENLYRTSKVALRFGFDEHGPGMGSLEAIGFGIPLIVNRGIGITELLDRYRYDLIFNEINPQIIAEAINKLSKERDYWEIHHKVMMSIASENSWEKQGTILSGIIKKVLGESP